jgi:hypothetical protein
VRLTGWHFFQQGIHLWFDQDAIAAVSLSSVTAACT